MAIRIKSCASREAVQARQAYFWDRTMRGFANRPQKRELTEVIIIISQCKTKHTQKQPRKIPLGTEFYILLSSRGNQERHIFILIHKKHQKNRTATEIQSLALCSFSV